MWLLYDQPKNIISNINIMQNTCSLCTYEGEPSQTQSYIRDLRAHLTRCRASQKMERGAHDVHNRTLSKVLGGTDSRVWPTRRHKSHDDLARRSGAIATSQVLSLAQPLFVCMCEHSIGGSRRNEERKGFRIRGWLCYGLASPRGPCALAATVRLC